MRASFFCPFLLSSFAVPPLGFPFYRPLILRHFVCLSTWMPSRPRKRGDPRGSPRGGRARHSATFPLVCPLPLSVIFLVSICISAKQNGLLSPFALFFSRFPQQSLLFASLNSTLGSLSLVHLVCAQCYRRPLWAASLLKAPLVRFALASKCFYRFEGFNT